VLLANPCCIDFLEEIFGWGTWIRTKTNGVRVPVILLIYSVNCSKSCILVALWIKGLAAKCKTFIIISFNGFTLKWSAFLSIDKFCFMSTDLLNRFSGRGHHARYPAFLGVELVVGTWNYFCNKSFASLLSVMKWILLHNRSTPEASRLLAPMTYVDLLANSP